MVSLSSTGPRGSENQSGFSLSITPLLRAKMEGEEREREVTTHGARFVPYLFSVSRPDVDLDIDRPTQQCIS